MSRNALKLIHHVPLRNVPVTKITTEGDAILFSCHTEKFNPNTGMAWYMRIAEVGG